MSEKDLGQQEPKPKKNEKGSSLLVGGALLLIAAYVFISGFFIRAPEGWQTHPGMLPILLGGSLFVMALIITMDAIKNGAWISLQEMLHGQTDNADSERSLKRVLIALAFIGGFYFVLLPILHFEIAAAIFLFAMTSVYWPEGKLVHRLLLAVLLPFFITISFQGVFGIPMPGKANFVQEILFWWKKSGG